LPLAVTPDGEVWMAREPGWAPHGLMHYDGTAWEEVLIENVEPSLSAIEAGADGEAWVLGFDWDTDEPVFARFDGDARTLYDWPFAERARQMAVGPDGTAWVVYGTSLRSFDWTTWTTHAEGTEIWGLDVAPDGTVWYADAEGVHTLGTP